MLFEEIEVPGVPVPKARPIVTKHGTFTPKKTQSYERRVALTYMGEKKTVFADNEILKVVLEFHLPIPDSYSNKRKLMLQFAPHNKKPDLDNLIKAVLDALNGVAFRDDSRVYCVEAKKLYSNEPKTIIKIGAI